MPYLSTVSRPTTLKVVRFVRLWIDYLVEFFFDLYHRNRKRTIPPVRNDNLLLSATKLARKIRTGELTSAEVVQMHIDRIKEVNDVINAVVDTRFELAMEEAAKVDRDIKNGRITEEEFARKPFLGVPFTSKESTLAKGMKASFGLIPRKGMIAEEDAEIVKLMKASGGILIGVTNVPQLNLWMETHNLVYGITSNPYDTTRNVGGSSGGEAAIISACGSPIGVGTDIGGSIRIPAYMCGLFGHKSTSHLTKTKGLTFRDGSTDDDTMLVAGPITRYAEDLIPGVKAILGPASKVLNLDAEVDVRKLKYYFIYDGGNLLMSTPRADVIEAMEKVVRHYHDIASVEELDIPNLKYVTAMYRYWLNKAGDFPYDVTGRTRRASAWTEAFKYFTGRSEFTFAVIMALFNCSVLPSVDENWAVETTSSVKKAMLDKLGEDSVLLYLSSPTVAQRHHVNYFRPFNVSTFCLFSLLKLPVTQIPMGLNSEGVPLGIQVVAAPNMDRLSIAVARDLEVTFGGYVPPFPISK